MKMLSAVAIIATLLSASAFAGDHTINAAGRTGWIYKDNDVEKTGTPNSSSFNFDYLRTTFSGGVSPTVKYYLTVDLLGETGNDSVDGTPSLIDEVFITKTFSFGMSATLGKKAVFIGGREYDYLNYDRYTNSYFYDATPANQVGLTLSYDFADQIFMAQYFNGNKNNGNGGTVNAQSKFGYSLGWYGNFLNGMIKPIVSYAVVPLAAGGTRTNKGDDQYIAGGVQVTMPHNVQFEFDYDFFNSKDAGASRADLKTTSMIGLVRYTGANFSPFLKFIKDTKKSDSAKIAERTAYDVGVEFKEATDETIRYHVVYSGSSVKDLSVTPSLKSSPKSILVGLIFDAAILK